MWYQRAQSSIGTQLPDVETSEFAQLFQTAMAEWKSSRNVMNPRVLIEQFITETMPHLGIRRVLNTYREADEFLNNLAGFEVRNENPNLSHQTFPNLAFRQFQVELEIQQIVGFCDENCGRQNSVTTAELRPFISIEHYEEDQRNLTLQNHIEALLNQHEEMVRFTCPECQILCQRVQKISMINDSTDCLFVKIGGTPNLRIQLGNDLSIETRDNGVIHYQLLGGIQQEGSRLSGHFGKYIKINAVLLLHYYITILLQWCIY